MKKKSAFKQWRCPICDEDVDLDKKKKHLIEEIENAQLNEYEWLQIGMQAKQLFRRLFKTEP